MPTIAKSKTAVVYDDGIRRVEYVARMPAEINQEIRRVVYHLQLALRRLRTMCRAHHPAVRAAIFVLRNVRPDITSSAASELARISFLMDEALRTLSVLKHSHADYLREARFSLLYGQTPKKRDRDAILGGSKDSIESETDNEDAREDE